MACSMKEVQERPQQVQVARLDAQINRHRTLAQVAPVEIIGGGGRIDQRIGKKIQAARKGLADGARRDRRQINDVGDGAHAWRWTAEIGRSAGRR